MLSPQLGKKLLSPIKARSMPFAARPVSGSSDDFAGCMQPQWARALIRFETPLLNVDAGGAPRNLSNKQQKPVAQRTKLLAIPIGFVNNLNENCSYLQKDHKMSGTMQQAKDEDGSRQGGPAAPAAMQTLRIKSEDLFQQQREVEIDHQGRIYRLRLTQMNKLILTA